MLVRFRTGFWAVVLSFAFAISCSEHETSNDEPQDEALTAPILFGLARYGGWFFIDYEENEVLQLAHIPPVASTECPIPNCISWPSIISLDPFDRETHHVNGDEYQFHMLHHLNMEMCGFTDLYVMNLYRNGSLEARYIIDAYYKYLIYYQRMDAHPSRIEGETAGPEEYHPHALLHICHEDYLGRVFDAEPLRRRLPRAVYRAGEQEPG